MNVKDQAAADDLRIFIDNDGELDRQMASMIRKNLMAKRARGEYDHARAIQAFMYLTEAGAKKYARDAGGPGSWHAMFSVPTRKEAARQLVESFEEEAKLGNYDDLIPKKYQGGGGGGASRAGAAKSKSDLEREIKGVVSKSSRRRA
jgi:hypothetical protein